MLEWYDFALFGFFAQQIGAHFFPADNPTASLLAAFGTFAAGFVMRPLGGALFGWVGDRFGRKQALLWSVHRDGPSILFHRLLPSAATIGIAAPILLLAVPAAAGARGRRGVQASSVFLVEGAEPGQRGWMGSWRPFGSFAGTLLGSAAGVIVNATMSPEDGPGLGLADSVHHRARRGTRWARHPTPLRGAGAASAAGEVAARRGVPRHWRTILHLVPLVAGLSVGFYTTFVYSATWLQQVADVPARTALGINTVAMALSLVASPVAGVERPDGPATGAVRGGGLPHAAVVPDDGADGAGGAARSSSARSVSRCWSPPAGALARDDGRAGAVAGAVHGGLDGAQPRDGAARRDHPARGGVAASRGPARRSRRRCTWPRAG